MHPVRRPLRVASATGCGFRVENDPKLYERLDCVVLHGPFGENPSTLAYIGALAGAALGQLGATYLVLFLAMLGIGIVQDPMFGDGTPGGLAYAFPRLRRREGQHGRSLLRRFPRLDRARARARVARRPRDGCHVGAT